MKNIFFLLGIILIACKNQSKKETSPILVQDSVVSSKPKSDIHFSGTGYINNKIPVSLQYRIHNDIISGIIIYTNTKGNNGLKLIGNIEEDNSYRVLEFERNGNISGIISGKDSASFFTGTWFSPKTRREFEIKLSVEKSEIQPDNFGKISNDISGEYRYQYSDSGSTGYVEISKLDNNRIRFSINCLTDPPAYNVADVPEDTITLNGNSFIYKIPGSDNCEFKMTFYNDFLTIAYTKGYCEGQFGHNATIDGIFLKTSNK